MKKTIITLCLIALLAGLFACRKSDDKQDTTDYSNIADLYYQPLPVIQKCIQGKWNWYVSYGGVAGRIYPQDTYVEFTDNYYIRTSPVTEPVTTPYMWKKLVTKEISGFGRDGETYVVCNKETEAGVWYFDFIKNDTLYLYSYAFSDQHLFTRVK